MIRDRLLKRLPFGSRGLAILRVSAYGLLSKVSSVANLLLTMPFVHQSLEPAGFGAWATLGSIATIAGFLDFGLSNGAMNLVAGAHARGEHREVHALAFSAWRTLCRTAIVLALLALALLVLLPWGSLLGLGSGMEGQARAAAAVTLAAMVAGVPLGLALRMQLATDTATPGYRLLSLGPLLACVGTVILARMGAPLAVLVAATLWPPVLMSLANTLLVARQLRASAPNDGDLPVDRSPRTQIQREGLLFFVLQLAAVLAYGCDLPLISASVGAEEAGQYAIVQRLFSLIPLALGLLWTPLWPAYRQALAKREYAWAFRTLRYSLTGAVLAASAVAATCWYWFGAISGAWMRTSIAPAPQLVAGMAAWSVADAAGGAYGTFLNAAAMFRFLVVTACLSSLATVALKAWLVAHGEVALLPWATLACFLLVDVAPLIVLWPRMASTIRARQY